jgi:hypothetical protein
MAAEAWLVAEQKLIDRDEWTPPGRRQAAEQPITLAEWAEQYFATRELADSTRREYPSERRVAGMLTRICEHTDVPRPSLAEFDTPQPLRLVDAWRRAALATTEARERDLAALRHRLSQSEALTVLGDVADVSWAAACCRAAGGHDVVAAPDCERQPVTGQRCTLAVRVIRAQHDVGKRTSSTSTLTIVAKASTQRDSSNDLPGGGRQASWSRQPCMNRDGDVFSGALLIAVSRSRAIHQTLWLACS